MTQEAYQTLTKSFDSIEISNGTNGHFNSSELANSIAKLKEQDPINFLPLVPSLPAMRLPQGIKNLSKYESVQ